MQNFDVTVNGLGLSDFGLVGGSLDGIGLTTYGFIWSCGSIWDTADEPITTTWSDCTDGGSTIETCAD